VGPALSFHHRNPKDKVSNVSTMVSKGAPRRVIVAEMKKCDILCLNCHHELEMEKHNARRMIKS
jgi:hypothetical protein